LSSPQPRSRRDRPAKPPLSRNEIVNVTVEIVEREGLGKATMRRVAQELDTGAASLYVYVRSTAELQSAVIDELIRRIPAPPDESWQARLRAQVTGYRDLLLRYPGLARSAIVVRPAGSNFMRLFDQLMGLLLEGGADPKSASRGADMLLLNAAATAAEHSMAEAGDPDADVDPVEEQRAIEMAVWTSDPAGTPHLAKHAEAVLEGSPSERWEWMLRSQVTGITGHLFTDLTWPTADAVRPVSD
jgi:AcrR family transcriptional regulator